MVTMISTHLKIGERAKIYHVRVNAVQVDKYVGTFKNEDLQSKSEIGEWETIIQGLPQAQQGYGSTPRLAVQDAIKRNQDMITKLKHAETILMANLEQFTDYDITKSKEISPTS